MKLLGDAEADSKYESARIALDDVLRRADFELSREPRAVGPIEVFTRIESVLVQADFVLCIKTETLHDMLVPQPLLSCSGKRQSGDGLFTQARKEQAQRHRRERASGHEPLVHLFDCDLGSFLYIAIGERRGLPISMAELPGHNWVRWTNQDGSHLNWDVNEARTYEDAELRHGTQTSSGCGANDATCDGRIPNGFFHTFTQADLEAYHRSLLYGLAIRGGNILLGESLLRESLKLQPVNPRMLNNLAWLLAVSRIYSSATVGKEAAALASQAVDMSPGDVEFRDTLSCAQAAAGDFKSAVGTEAMANNKQARLERYRLNCDCRGSETLFSD